MARNYTKRKVWTPDEVKYLKVLSDAGASRSVIAKELDRTYNAVCKKLNAMGLTKQEGITAGGVLISQEQVSQAINNGISLEAVRRRVERGMSVEQSITEPTQQRKREQMTDETLTHDELVKIVGRMKYMNLNECKTNPMQPTKPMLERLKERNITVDEIREVEC